MNDATIGVGNFERLREALNRHFGDSVVSSWMYDLECVEVKDDSAVLSTESALRRDTISQRYMPQLKDALRDCFQRTIRTLRIVKREKAREDAQRVDGLKSALGPVRIARSRADKTAEAPGSSDLFSPIDERATFESFAVDETNEMAYAAARLVFADRADADIIYFSGPSGVGKTHLLFAIANEHRRRFGEGRCAYITYHALQSGTVNAVFSNSVSALQKDLLSRDVLLIDDIHLLSTSTRTQAELLNLVKAALSSRRRIVIAGELTPQKLRAAGFNENLADRLSGGLCVPMLPGDAAHRARVLKKQLQSAPLPARIEDGAVDYIAENFPQSLREAIGALKQLQLAYAEREEPVGRLEAEKVLRERAMETRRAPSFEETAKAVATSFDLTLEEFKSRGQYQRLVRARHIFSILARENLHESFPRIAKFLGRDHTTIISGYRRGQALIERDKKLKEQLGTLRGALGFPAA